MTYGPHPLRAAAYSERYVFLGGPYVDVYRAMDDGSAVRKLTFCELTACNYANPALSPHGQTIALDTGYEQISLMDITGANERVLVHDPYYFAWNPEFTPDGKQVTYTGYSGGAFGFYGIPQTCPPPYTTVPAQAIPDLDTNNSGLVCYRGDNNCTSDDNTHEEPVSTGDYDTFSMYVEGDPVDGSARWVVAGGEGDQEDVEFSPDGQTLAWTNRATPGETTKIWTAGGTTCDPAAPLDTSSQISGDVWEPKISPDGTKIAFYARPVPLSYPRQDACNRDFPVELCGGLFERSRNGAEPWLRNYDDPTSSVLRFPATRGPGYHSSWSAGPRNWVDWPGNWSISETNVKSPGWSLHFWSPWEYNQCKTPSCTLPSRTGRGASADARC